VFIRVLAIHANTLQKNSKNKFGAFEKIFTILCHKKINKIYSTMKRIMLHIESARWFNPGADYIIGGHQLL
jgi:hypothetical protein